jgi:signal transduction histidine kinase
MKDSQSTRKPLRKEALRIALIYSVIGIIWIMVSDNWVRLFQAGSLMATRMQTFKGLAYVLATGYLLYLMVVRSLERVREAEESLQKEQEKGVKLEGAIQTIRTFRHEINNPLQALCMTLDMMAATTPSSPEKTQKHMQRLNEAARRIVDVVDRMGKITQFESLSSPAGDRLAIPADPPSEEKGR